MTDWSDEMSEAPRDVPLWLYIPRFKNAEFRSGHLTYDGDWMGEPCFSFKDLDDEPFETGDGMPAEPSHWMLAKRP